MFSFEYIVHFSLYVIITWKCTGNDRVSGSYHYLIWKISMDLVFLLSYPIDKLKVYITILLDERGSPKGLWSVNKKNFHSWLVHAKSGTNSFHFHCIIDDSCIFRYLYWFVAIRLVLIIYSTNTFDRHYRAVYLGV
jgi:hypothetical protein